MAHRFHCDAVLRRRPMAEQTASDRVQAANAARGLLAWMQAPCRRRAILVNTCDVGDTPVVPEQRQQSPVDMPIAALTGDGACDTKTAYEFCHEHTMPIIPARKRAQKRQGAAFAPRHKAIAASLRSANRRGHTPRRAHSLIALLATAGNA